MRSMFDIIKLTPVYDAVEDRLRLNIQTRQGPVLSMWLTQRLGTLVVLNLARQLDEEVKAEAAGLARAPLHQFEQSAAVSRHKPDTAVKAAQAADNGLVQRVDVGRRGAGYVLTWAAVGGAEARMSIDGVQLRQFLEIFRRVYAKAQWDMQSWPVWLRQPAAATQAAVAGKPQALH